MSERLLPDSSKRSSDLNFAMGCNGYFLNKSGQWVYNPFAVGPISGEFKATRVSFFGPGTWGKFFSGANTGYNRFSSAFGQRSVIDVLEKNRMEVDNSHARRIAFLLGGLVRHMRADEASKAVEFVASGIRLGYNESRETIANALAMYVISGGSLDKNRYFFRNVYHMAEAVRRDPVIPLETADLGLSQVSRLRGFFDYSQGKESRLPDISQCLKFLEGFPTVGAEFHFSPDILNDQERHPNLWQRLAILNMSQYQRDSYIQLSKNDRGVIEVRMNPSIYPVAIANWNHIRLIFPELNNAFFTITINRDTKEDDFNWASNKDRPLINKLRSLGMLIYAGLAESIPPTEKREEIDFGSIYLGQTVKLRKGKYLSSGYWSKGGWGHGQLGIYSGFGNSFPYLAYRLSMAVKNPDVLSHDPNNLLSTAESLQGALAVGSAKRRGFFEAMQTRILIDRELSKAVAGGNQIMELLNP